MRFPKPVSARYMERKSCSPAVELPQVVPGLLSVVPQRAVNTLIRTCTIVSIASSPEMMDMCPVATSVVLCSTMVRLVYTGLHVVIDSVACENLNATLICHSDG